MNQFVRRWPEDLGMDLRVAYRSLRQYPLAAFVIPVGAIVLVGLAATWLPARRAASIDPAALLRSE